MAVATPTYKNASFELVKPPLKYFLTKRGNKEFTRE
jgi:hypothetical protein